jgi:hypothetical protein
MRVLQRSTRLGFAAILLSIPVATFGVIATPEIAFAADPLPGFQIVSSSWTAANGIQTSGSVTCPGAEVPAGGGVQVSSTSIFANVNSSYPLRHGWTAAVNNTSGADTSATVYASCINKKPSYEVATTTIDNPSGSPTQGSAACKDGRHALGGGSSSSSSSTEVNVAGSYAAGKNYMAIMNNASISDDSLTVYAICEQLRKDYAMISTSLDAPPESQTSGSFQYCVGTTDEVSGGYDPSFQPSTSANVNSMYPVTRNDWVIRINNASESDSGGYMSVICVNP